MDNATLILPNTQMLAGGTIPVRDPSDETVIASPPAADASLPVTAFLAEWT